MRTALALAVSGLVGLGVMVFGAPSATASSAPTPSSSVKVIPADNSQCPSNNFCLFQNTNYGGWGLAFPATSGYAYGLSGIYNNAASSMINNTGRNVYLYDSSDCSGNYGYKAVPHSVDTTFVNNNFNDKTSCLYVS